MVGRGRTGTLLGKTLFRKFHSQDNFSFPAAYMMKYEGKTANQVKRERVRGLHLQLFLHRQAVITIRGLRARSVETRAQESCLADFEKYLNQGSSSKCLWTLNCNDNDPVMQKKVFLPNIRAPLIQFGLLPIQDLKCEFNFSINYIIDYYCFILYLFIAD